jgi:hypothetical protein
MYKCKISQYSWPKLQIISSGIKNNSEVLKVGQNKNLVSVDSIKILDGFR